MVSEGRTWPAAEKKEYDLKKDAFKVMHLTDAHLDHLYQEVRGTCEYAYINDIKYKGRVAGLWCDIKISQLYNLSPEHVYFVPFQLCEKHICLQLFRHIELIVLSAISVLPGIHLDVK